MFDASNERGAHGVPPVMRQVINDCKPCGRSGCFGWISPRRNGGRSLGIGMEWGALRRAASPEEGDEGEDTWSGEGWVLQGGRWRRGLGRVSWVEVVRGRKWLLSDSCGE